MSGTLANTYIITLITAEASFPIMIELVLMDVVRSTSMVFFSRSPDIEVAVIIGTISPMITS